MAVSRAQLEVQLGPHLAVFGLKAQVCLATRAPNSSKCVHKEIIQNMGLTARDAKTYQLANNVGVKKSYVW